MNRQAGFTLVEMLVAMMLLSLMLAAMYGGLRLAGASWDRSVRGPAKGEAVESAQTLLRRILTQAYPVQNDRASTPQLDFDGIEDRLSFWAPAPGRDGDVKLSRYRLSVAPNQGRMELRLSADDSETVLFADIRALKISYYGEATGEVTSWRHQSSLPRLVRLRLALGDSSWPELLVAPRIAVNDRCDYDASSRDCRVGP